MEKLTNKEEEVMLILWRLKKAFVKEIIEEMEEPRPHYNTVSTIIRILEDKGFVNHESFGKSHRYYPLITQDAYKRNFISGIVDNYFGHSFKNMVSFFAKKEHLSKEDLEEILKLIEQQDNE